MLTGGMSLPRARVVTLNAALGPLDYRVPAGMRVEPGTVVIAPLGPRQLIGVAWVAERLPSEEVGDNRLRPLAGLVDVAPIAAPLRRLAEWTADYYLSPLASVLRMILPSAAASGGREQCWWHDIRSAGATLRAPRRWAGSSATRWRAGSDNNRRSTRRGGAAAWR